MAAARNASRDLILENLNITPEISGARLDAIASRDRELVDIIDRAVNRRGRMNLL